MVTRILNIWRPDACHAHPKKSNFFEGWFYKLVNAEKNQVYAVIPGVLISDNPEHSHAFIQFLDGQSHQATYQRYPLSKFYASPKKLEIEIESNFFSTDRLELNMKTNDRSITGKLAFHKITRWPVIFTSPGIMGWYAFVPFMECYHSVVSLDHEIEGSVKIYDKKVNFNKGRGYIEKDWGKSFPSAYLWIQSNHFDRPGISLIASVAIIPWLRGSFRGFIIGLLLNGKLQRFTTYTGAELEYLRIRNTDVRLAVFDKAYRLEIEAIRVNGGLLHAPYERQMLKRVSETLCSHVKIRFYRIRKNEKLLLYAGEAQPAGLDVNGNLDEIMG